MFMQKEKVSFIAFPNLNAALFLEVLLSYIIKAKIFIRNFRIYSIWHNIIF